MDYLIRPLGRKRGVVSRSIRHRLKLFSAVFMLLAVFLLAGTVMAQNPPPSEAEDLTDPEVMEALAIRYVAGEDLTDKEEAAAIRYITPHVRRGVGVGG